MKLNLTPDPRILVALTATPLSPLDALCELIDNAIDSFTDARLQGTPIQYPLVVVQIPGPAEIRRGVGAVIVRDNGLGLTREGAERALTAGFSGKNPRGGRLGLFGMGFNIASGKLGHRTRFFSATQGSADAIEVTVDLNEMQAQRSYEVPAEMVSKPTDFSHGTVVEISGWWPEGNPNHGFIRKLSAYPAATIAKQLSRRYATILRESGVRLHVNQIPCEPYEHCVWDRSRAVERRGTGQIPARFEFNEVLATQSRCTECDTLIVDGQIDCPQCASQSKRSVDERVRGWIGIQRFDDPTEFGIDLVRNGRAIRIGEKDAFFTFVDEFKREIKDYPVDGPYGRIVGEIHLDHVPVDFLKQDFQRSSDEWRRAIGFLRGDSSLQPNQPNADGNRSFVFRLYQGYRKVRNFGRADMYMGVWAETEQKARRVSRDIEREYYAKFLNKEPGFYDDAEWWKLVESADRPPAPQLSECPACHAENLQEAESCQVCSVVLRGQACINQECNELIPVSAVSCPHCGASQIPEIEEPWKCEVCSAANAGSSEACARCGRARGTPNPTSRAHMLANAAKDDVLSIRGLSVRLADESYSQAQNVDVYATAIPLTPVWQGKNVPMLVLKSEDIEIFIDRSHAVFRSYRISAEALVASELAQYLYDRHRALLSGGSRGAHSVSNIAWEIMAKYWNDQLEDSADRVRADIERFFSDVKEELPRLVGEIAEDLFRNLAEDDQRALTNNLLAEGQDLARLGDWSRSGEYLRFVEPTAIVRIFRSNPELFFDDGIWSLPYSELPGGLQESVVRHVQNEIKTQYLNCLEDCQAYLRYARPDALITQRARVSLTFLTQRAI